jgi:peptide chain release factor 2
VLREMASAENDASSLAEISDHYGRLQQEVARLEFVRKLSGDDDRSAAVLAIHSGAGGTESCDWCEMLFRMYTRWLERKGYAFTLLDIIPGEEAGLRSATIEVNGEYAYGHLKAETGVHRLVRISPFDANARRHTSFASVFAYPLYEETDDIELDEKDIRIDTYRASGAGGQHINKTDSAVRMTHIPTNIVVQCQNERSQIKNRSTAMRLLKSRVKQFYKEEEDKKRQDKLSDKKKIEWGSQIRSYVLHPYNMVKDHRTDVETSNTQAVLDGDIDQFIESYLLAFA